MISEPSTRLAFEAVSHGYRRDVPVLDAVSLAVHAGEILCLLGPSGCGKTTLLRIAAGIERQTKGLVYLDGRLVAGPAVFEPPERRGIGLIFQDYALFPHMDVLANVRFGVRGLSAREAEAVAREALGRTGLGALARAWPHELSGGQQQRVALARAMAPKPAVLMMDEPFSNLDRRTREDVREATATVLRSAGATTVLVTHDAEEAMRMGDRIAVMQAGRLVEVGTPEALYRRPLRRETAAMLGDLAEVPGAIAGRAIDTPLGRFPAPGLADGPGMLALRPGALAIADGAGGVPARVVGRTFLGEADVVSIMVEGHGASLALRVRPGVVIPGDVVRLRIDLAEVLVFAIGDA